jgi:uncharacterized protein YegP (UPF0339 family)
MKRKPKTAIYRDKKGEWRWQLVATNGRILADSGESYVTVYSATHALVRAYYALRDALGLSRGGL